MSCEDIFIDAPKNTNGRYIKEINVFTSINDNNFFEIEMVVGIPLSSFFLVSQIF